MSKPPAEPVSVVIPFFNVADGVERAVRDWHSTLQRLGVEFELILVDDGSTDRTPDVSVFLAGKLANVRVLRHESRQGFGACLRTAFAESRQPLFFYTALDYPYTPADIALLLERIGHVDELLNRPIDLVSGRRRGVPVPRLWAAIGRLYRGFCRIGLGLPREPLPGWLGLREHVRSWLVWVLFGDPLVDPNSAFKLIRRSVLDRFPIQSDGEFVHVEIVGKATFLTSLMDEISLTPKPQPVSSPPWADLGLVLTRAEFFPPVGLTEVSSDPPAQVLSEAGVDGARAAAEPATTG